MKKKDEDEFGILITREMKAMLLDGDLSYENRAKIMCSIIGGEELTDPMLRVFANSLRTGYDSTNNKRKAEILSRRERQRGYQQKLRRSISGTSTVDECTQTETTVDESTVDKRNSTEISVDARASLNKAKQSNTSNNIPLNPPSGVEGEIPPKIDAEDIMAGTEQRDALRRAAAGIAGRIEQTEAYGHMRVNRGKLMKCLCSLLKKNGGAEKAEEVSGKILKALDAWTEFWRRDEWKYKPGRVTDWLYDDKWLEEPRCAESVPVAAGCGPCGIEIA